MVDIDFIVLPNELFFSINEIIFDGTKTNVFQKVLQFMFDVYFLFLPDLKVK